MKASTIKYFCTNSPALFYSADSVYDNHWNYGTAAGSGTMGFGKNSPVWEIIGSPSAGRYYDIDMACFNQWTFADPSWTATTQQSFLNFGGFSDSYSDTDAHTSFNPEQLGSYLFSLDTFGFGKTDTTAKTEFYEDLMNYDEDPVVYGGNMNSTNLAMNFRGLGLPIEQFNKFSNLLSVITKGEATCLSRMSGYCALPRTCESYTASGLWDFDFKIKFETTFDTNYLRVPLATFAANSDLESGNCAIFVEYLDSFFQDSQAIILGSMFFQSVYARYSLQGISNVQVDLFVNQNALASTYLGSDTTLTQMTTSPFSIYVADILTDPGTEQNGLPTFLATAAGITDSLPYWHLDFNADRTIAWSTNCMTSGFANYPAAACTEEPVLGYNGFDGSPLPASTGTFTGASFGGYIVSGTKYTSKMCFGNWNCKFIQLYGVDEVSADEWNFGVDAGYGTIGMGPSSFIWEGFIDPETKRATYSIELARVSLYSEDEGLQANNIKSNITFGASSDTPYVGANSIYMPSLANYTYALNNFAFGIVYTDSDGADSSDYFYQLGTNYPVQFSINFKGLGLPANLYA
jgi:hypothetical protein